VGLIYPRRKGPDNTKKKKLNVTSLDYFTCLLTRASKGIASQPRQRFTSEESVNQVEEGKKIRTSSFRGFSLAKQDDLGIEQKKKKEGRGEKSLHYQSQKEGVPG